MSSRALRGRAIEILSSFRPTLCSSHHCKPIERASRLLHDPTSSALSPSAPAMRAAFQQLPVKPRGAFRAASTYSDISGYADRFAEIDGFASAPCAIEKAWFFRGFRSPTIGEGIAATQHTLPSDSMRGTLFASALIVFVWHATDRVATRIPLFHWLFDHALFGKGNISQHTSRRLLAATRRCVVMDDTKPPSAQRQTHRMWGVAGGMQNS
jgi:hypothetical protein